MHPAHQQWYDGELIGDYLLRSDGSSEKALIKY